jgi:hypothetical protein
VLGRIFFLGFSTHEFYLRPLSDLLPRHVMKKFKSLCTGKCVEVSVSNSGKIEHIRRGTMEKVFSVLI